jgi:hypothetical protein
LEKKFKGKRGDFPIFADAFQFFGISVDQIIEIKNIFMDLFGH